MAEQPDGLQHLLVERPAHHAPLQAGVLQLELELAQPLHLRGYVRGNVTGYQSQNRYQSTRELSQDRFNVASAGNR